MLPDFPDLKAEIERILLARLRAKIHTKDPVVAQIRRFTQHEGRRQRYEQRPSGKVVEDGFELFSTEVTAAIQEVPNLVGKNLEQKLDEIADKAGSAMAKRFFQRVGEECDKAGTSINAGGEQMNPELLLEMMSTVQTDFDSNGNPTSMFVLHPDTVPAALKISEQIENDPELKRRSDEIRRKQREAWVTRESNRKLVD